MFSIQQLAHADSLSLSLHISIYHLSCNFDVFLLMFVDLDFQRFCKLLYIVRC